MSAKNTRRVTTILNCEEALNYLTCRARTVEARIRLSKIKLFGKLNWKSQRKCPGAFVKQEARAIRMFSHFNRVYIIRRSEAL